MVYVKKGVAKAHRLILREGGGGLYLLFFNIKGKIYLHFWMAIPNYSCVIYEGQRPAEIFLNLVINIYRGGIV